MKKIFFIPYIFFISLSVFSQNALDPNDDIYTWINRWEAKGIVSRLPALRPYPPALLQKIFHNVLEKGDLRDSEAARFYLEYINSDFGITISPNHESRIATTEYFGQTGVLVNTISNSLEMTSILLKVGVFGIDKDQGFQLPRGTPNSRDEYLDGFGLPMYIRPELDYVQDSAEIPMIGNDWALMQSINTGVFIGSSDLYFSAGLQRNAFGPLWYDGAVISSEAPHIPTFGLTLRTDGLTFTTILMEMVATDYFGNGRYPGKHYRLHSATFHLFEWWDFTFIESVIWGDRFDLFYMLPLSELTYQQMYSGLSDNSLVGFATSFLLPSNIKTSLTVFADDLDFDEIIRFNFATKYKLSFQIGAYWSPDVPFIHSIYFDYLAVMPYMYTHNGGFPDLKNSPNYSNYTHDGFNLGPTVDPNSDRLTLGFRIFMEPEIILDGIFRFMRHGNPSDDSIRSPNDGSIFDDGYTKTYGASFNDRPTQFLTQSVLEYVFQAGVDAKTVIPVIDTISLKLNSSYTFEYVQNKDISLGINEFNHYFAIGTGMSF